MSRFLNPLLATAGALALGLSGPQLSAELPQGASAHDSAPLPSSRQLAWHRMEAYAFVHFTVNTFTDKEWGYGDEDPAVFNPSNFDAEQIAGAVRAAGLKGLVLTAKHHDGFCLWPSNYTDHSIAHSPYKGGKGDIVGEMAAACKKLGLRFGIYLSPWDRNRADYGTPAYLDYYRAQLQELLTNYGPIFEIWFDGANGGDGYYGGARETRKIDNTTYYDWPTTWALARRLQPDAVLFSDGGPDARWVGNETGAAGNPCWHTINGEHFVPGHAEGLPNGSSDGRLWLPAEVDVSIRPGWFYHESEDAKVKTPAELFDIYLSSVGRGANLILNLCPDKRGLIPERDEENLRRWKRLRDACFAQDMAAGASFALEAAPAGQTTVPFQALSDGNLDSYWSPEDKATSPTLLITLPEARRFDLIDLREYLPLGQRLRDVSVDCWDDGLCGWREIAHASSIGNRRLLRLGTSVSATRLRLRLTGAATPALSEFHLYQTPAIPAGDSTID